MNTAALLALLALNLSICWRLFKVEYTLHFNSIEGAFIAIARYISRHWGDFSWWPLWHCGMPYQNTYVPLLHLVVALTATLGNISAARAYHGVVGATYALGAATLYLMAVRLGAHRGAAFVAAVLYSLFSPSALLMPDVARDIGGLWDARRLHVLTVYGEGPHISAMTMLPVAVLGLENALTRRTGRAFSLAALAIAIVFLTNVPGAMALGLAVFCWICSQPAGRRRAAWAIAGSAAALAYGLACYGVPPSSVGTVAGNVQSMHPGFSNSLRYGPLLLMLVFTSVAAAGHLLARTPIPLFVRFAILYFGLTAALVLTAHWETFDLLPQVGRLHLEMEMGASLLLGYLGWTVYGLMPGRVRSVALALCIVPLAIQFGHYRARARMEVEHADLAQRSEFTTARWLDANLNGGRVYVTGSTSFWLNAFTDTPQMVGCCDQGQSMPVLGYVPYRINVGVSPRWTELSKSYLQALGVQAMVVNGAASTDEYKNIQAPERFEGLFPVLHREKGDTVYSVSDGRPSLAHVVRPEEQIPLRASGQVDDSDVVRYAQAIEHDRRAAVDFRWLRGSAATMRATLRRDELLSVHVPWFPGWKALVGGQRKQVSADGLGFLVIRPECEGDCEIALQWTGPRDRTLSAVISAAALLITLFYCSRRTSPGPRGSAGR